MRRANREINFRLKASPGRGKLSPQVTDEGAGKKQFAGNYPSSGAARHPLPLLSLRDIFPRPGDAFRGKWIFVPVAGITLHIAPRFATIRREKLFYGKEA